MNNNLVVDIEVLEGPNDEGKTFVCPSKLCDPNLSSTLELNVAHAPQLSFITKVMVLSTANIFFFSFQIYLTFFSFQAPHNTQSHVLSLLARNANLTGSFLVILISYSH